MAINPFAHYWLADDGRVFDSANQIVTDGNDPGYVVWTGLGNVATTWPLDEAGNQTNESMQAVVGPLGMFVDLTYYAADARYRHASGGIQSSGNTYNTDVVSRNTVASAYTFSLGDPSQMFDWKLADGSFIALDAAAVAVLNTNVATFVQSCFSCESDTVAAINSGTITTRQQVDDAFAAISNVFP